MATRFTGYETEEQATTVAAVRSIGADGNGDGESGEPTRLLVKLAESPFYAPGGGQVADGGTIECADGDCRAVVREVFRVGEDQALEVVLEQGTLAPGEPVLARVDRASRHATEANHTATHLLQAVLRERLGAHVRQAGSYVGPDKLRFDFSHGQALSEQELRDVEDRVNAWVARNEPVRAVTTTLDEARRLGAMALFGEKYGEVVRMVQIGEGEYSRELCGGTHVRSTAEIGPFRIISETSSAANVRRIEALSGPAAIELLRAHDRALAEVAAQLRALPEDAPAALARLLAGAQAPANASFARARAPPRAARTSRSSPPGSAGGWRGGARRGRAGTGCEGPALAARSPEGTSWGGRDRAGHRRRGARAPGRERRAGARGAWPEGR